MQNVSGKGKRKPLECCLAVSESVNQLPADLNTAGSGTPGPSGPGAAVMDLSPLPVLVHTVVDAELHSRVRVDIF